MALLFDVRGFKLEDLYLHASPDEDTAIVWCQDHDLLWQHPQCQICGQLMLFRDRGSRSIFRCRPCDFQHSIRDNTFFDNSHLSVTQILRFIYMWSMDRFHQTDYKHQLDIGSNSTVVDWKNYCRDICAEYLLANPTQIGGAGRVVEIDESLLVRRKYNVGRLVREQWVFGGVEVGTNTSFLVPVARRDAATLEPIIMQYILPNTTIISDCWAAYNNISNLPGNYRHITVNHSRNFVDPVTGACTNHIESVWQKAKQKHKARYGTHRRLLESYLVEFMWRRIFETDAFHHILDQIRSYYPVF